MSWFNLKTKGQPVTVFFLYVQNIQLNYLRFFFSSKEKENQYFAVGSYMILAYL